MEEVIIKSNGAEYTMPKENIVPFAQFEALQRGLMTIVATEGAAIEFLKSLGIEVVYA